MIYKTQFGVGDVILDLECDYFSLEPDPYVGFEGEKGIHVSINKISAPGGPFNGSMEELEEFIDSDEEYEKIWEQWKKEQEV